jgi:ABC-2 type transport system ATP-binding protein
MLEDVRAIEYPDEIAQIMVNAGAPPTRLVVEQQNLEDHFLQLTGGAK